jgi:hypothetical protein
MVGRLARPVIGLILLAMPVGGVPAASADPEPPPLWRQVVELVRGIGSVVEATGHTAQVVSCMFQVRACDDQALGTDSVEEAEALEAQAAGLRAQADEAAVGVVPSAATQAMNDKVGWFADQVQERADDLRRAGEASPIISEHQQRLTDAAANLERVGQPGRPLADDLADIDEAVTTTAWLLDRLNELQGTYRTSAGARRQVDRTRREAIATRERILDEVISYLDGHVDRLGDLDDAELREMVDRLHGWVAHLVEQAELCENGPDCDRLLDRAGQLLDRSERLVDEMDRRAAVEGAEPDPAPRERSRELRAEIHDHGMDTVSERYVAWLERKLAERKAVKAARAAEEAARTAQGEPAAPAAETPAEADPQATPVADDAASTNGTEVSIEVGAGGTDPGPGEEEPTIGLRSATVVPSDVGPVVPLTVRQPAPADAGKVFTDDDKEQKEQAEQVERSVANVVEGVLGGKVAPMAPVPREPGVIADPVLEIDAGGSTGFPVVDVPTAAGCAGPLAAFCKEDPGPNVLVQTPELPAPSIECLSVTGFCRGPAPGGIDLDIWHPGPTDLSPSSAAW